MNFVELPKSQWPIIGENEILKNAVKVLINDNNMKPLHIAVPAQYTEFHIVRNSDTLLIAIGESWTYGESLSGIGSGAGLFNFHSQIHGCFAPRMAEILGCDLYQFAIPGNCNLWMSIELKRILKYVATLGYKKVLLAYQMTENAREMPLKFHELTLNHPIHNWFNTGTEKPIHILEWLKMYDEIFLNELDESVKNFTACPINAIMFRNFLKLHTDKRDYNFKIIEPTWIEYTSRLVNHKHESPSIMNVIEFENHIKHFGQKIVHDREFMEQQISLTSQLFDYVGSGNVYHNNHPTKWGHLVWAIHLTRQAGWKNI